MKTRILYPKNIWYNKNFKGLTTSSKVVSIYLVSNENIGLTRIYQQHDLEVCFICSLRETDLVRVKTELENADLFYFKDEWVYINNDFAYVDYEGRDRLMDAKQQELEAIPVDITEYFKGVTNRLKTSNKPPINNNTEIINNNTKIQIHKREYKTLESVNDPVLFKEIAQKYGTTADIVADRYEDLEIYCTSKNKRYADYYFALLNFVKSGKDRKSNSFTNNGKPNIAFINPE